MVVASETSAELASAPLRTDGGGRDIGEHNGELRAGERRGGQHDWRIWQHSCLGLHGTQWVLWWIGVPIIVLAWLVLQ